MEWMLIGIGTVAGIVCALAYSHGYWTGYEEAMRRARRMMDGREGR